MEAKKLYERLECDFILPGMSDDWTQSMDPVSGFLCDNYKTRSMGLVCDFTEEITAVYTAVFPAPKVMHHILDNGARNTLLFVHHPAVWDIRNTSEVFQQMDAKLLERFRDRRIAIYNLHSPLDNYGEFSTSVTLAKALGIKPEKAFGPYNGGLAGVLGKAECLSVRRLQARFREVTGHDVRLYAYGSDDIKDGSVALVAGGGLTETIGEISRLNVNLMVTGISAKNEFSIAAHMAAERNGISILGGTHYSTEKFACMEMTGYFVKLGLPAIFMEDEPVMEDM